MTQDGKQPTLAVRPRSLGQLADLPAVEDYVEQTLPTLQAHLKTARQIQKQLKTPNAGKK